MGLRLNESKTRVVDACQEGFTFLGFEIRMAKSHWTGNHYPHVAPSKKSLKAIKDRITELTARTRTVMPLDLLTNEVNKTVRGWVGYFHVLNCSKALSNMRRHLEERLREPNCGSVIRSEIGIQGMSGSHLNSCHLYPVFHLLLISTASRKSS